MRALMALVACAVVGAGCGDDDDSSVPAEDAGLDASTDGALDAALDAATDAPVGAPGETCANPIDVASYARADDGAYHVPGNLDDFADDIDGCGLPNEDSDAVYVFVPPADGQIRTTLGNDAYADLIVRTACDDPASELSCIGYPGMGCYAEPCGHVDAVSAGSPVYLVVDGLFTAARDYVLTLQHYPWIEEGGACADNDLARTCAPPMLCRLEDDGTRRCREMTCGDGLAEGDLFHEIGEECDDGNTNDGDGCSASCTLETQGPGGDDCAGAAPFRLVHGNPGMFTAPYGSAASDTSAASADLGGSCTDTTLSPDEVWRLDLAEDGPLTIVAASQTEGYRPVLYMLADDGAGSCSAEELGCGVAAEGAGVTLRFESLAAGTYYVVVDGVDVDPVSAGAYTLEALADAF